LIGLDLLLKLDITNLGSDDQRGLKLTNIIVGINAIEMKTGSLEPA
jgi:hypothetical protein